MTTIVADTGDLESIKSYAAQDATTNPSLLLKAAAMQQYQIVVDRAVEKASKNTSEQRLEKAMDQLAVEFGTELLKIIPGKVSTEVDANLSFDTEATIKKAHELIALYEEKAISKDRILIKIASTWEGIQAAMELEKQGIHCNLTLLFGFEQAVACADAKVFLISPFVGRIMDWYKIKEGRSFSPEEDPGVLSVKRIYEYFKKFGHETIVLGASFRNIGQIEELAGCDRLTISPQLLEELQNDHGILNRKLKPEDSSQKDLDVVNMDEKNFRWMHNENPMAVEKLSEGIRVFNQDLNKLRKFLSQKI